MRFYVDEAAGTVARSASSPRGGGPVADRHRRLTGRIGHVSDPRSGTKDAAVGTAPDRQGIVLVTLILVAGCTWGRSATATDAS